LSEYRSADQRARWEPNCAIGRTLLASGQLVHYRSGFLRFVENAKQRCQGKLTSDLAVCLFYLHHLSLIGASILAIVFASMLSVYTRQFYIAVSLLSLFCLQNLQAAQKLPNGAKIYRQQCVKCHGDKGQGVKDKYDDPLEGDWSLQK